MRPIMKAGGVVAVLALAVLGVAVGASGFGVTDSQGTAAQEDCPENARRLPALALAPASIAGLESQRSRYQDELGTRPLVARAALAEFDDIRGREARRDCGRRVERRTVVVYLESASRRFRRGRPSLSQAVVFVSFFPGNRYRVWRVVR
jgi:hypothetical protein